MLSQRGRYALKALLCLARRDPEQLGVSAIAEAEQIPRKYLEAIMTELRKAQIVESTRGWSGGYRLARPADLITFGEVIRLTDGPLALLPCASRNFYKRCDDCPDETACALRQVMARVRNEVSVILDRTTLADALAGAGPIRLLDETTAEFG
jgi:Rrf2 family protein